MFNTEPPAGARAVPGGECWDKPGRGVRAGWAPTVLWVKGRLRCVVQAWPVLPPLISRFSGGFVVSDLLPAQGSLPSLTLRWLPGDGAERGS